MMSTLHNSYRYLPISSENRLLSCLGMEAYLLLILDSCDCILLSPVNTLLCCDISMPEPSAQSLQASLEVWPVSQ